LTGETISTQALSLGLYLICPNSIRESSFLANGSFFKPKVIQNPGLCFLPPTLSLGIQI